MNAPRTASPASPRDLVVLVEDNGSVADLDRSLAALSASQVSVAVVGRRGVAGQTPGIARLAPAEVRPWLMERLAGRDADALLLVAGLVPDMAAVDRMRGLVRKVRTG